MSEPMTNVEVAEERRVEEMEWTGEVLDLTQERWDEVLDKAIGLQDEVLCALQLKKISYDIINYIVKEGGNPITLNQFIEQLVKDSTCPITDKGYEGTFVPTEYYVEGKTFNRDKHKH